MTMADNNNSAGSSSRFRERRSEDIIKAEEKKETSINAIPFYKLFSFADTTDKILMFLGTIGAVGNGLCQILVVVLFGNVVDSFGLNHTSNVLQAVSK
ncbi:abc transporter b family member 11, partial [Nicotiana attenuata]